MTHTTAPAKTPPRPRGRPRFAPGEARLTRNPLLCYVAPAMRADVQAAAKAAGVSVSAWIERACALHLGR